MNKRLNKLMLAMVASGLGGAVVVGCGGGNAPDLTVVSTPAATPITAA